MVRQFSSTSDCRGIGARDLLVDLFARIVGADSDHHFAKPRVVPGPTDKSDDPSPPAETSRSNEPQPVRTPCGFSGSGNFPVTQPHRTNRHRLDEIKKRHDPIRRLSDSASTTESPWASPNTQRRIVRGVIPRIECRLFHRVEADPEQIFGCGNHAKAVNRSERPCPLDHAHYRTAVSSLFKAHCRFALPRPASWQASHAPLVASLILDL